MAFDYRASNFIFTFRHDDASSGHHTTLIPLIFCQLRSALDHWVRSLHVGKFFCLRPYDEAFRSVVFMPPQCQP
jgi:hypothetical protein